MNQEVEQKIRVTASVYPTSHNKIWLSSGRVPRDDLVKCNEYINFLVFGFGGKMRRRGM